MPRNDFTNWIILETTLIPGASPFFYLEVIDPEAYQREIRTFPILTVLRDGQYLATLPFQGTFQTVLRITYGDPNRIISDLGPQAIYTLRIPPFMDQIRQVIALPRLRPRKRVEQ